MPRDRRRNKLVMQLSNEEVQELFTFLKSFKGPLCGELRSSLASATAGKSKGSFLWTVMMTYDCDKELARRELREQYLKKGSAWMEARWGFAAGTIRSGLRELGIRTKSRLYNNAPHGLSCEAFSRYGGIENVLRMFRTMHRFSAACRIHPSTLGQYLRKKGYRYNKSTRSWEKCQKLTL